MLPRIRPTLPLLLAALAASPLLAAEPAATLTIHADKPGPAIPPTIHGIFFEDINYAGDGGLYAELVQNRSFEHADALFAWSPVKRTGAAAEITVETDEPLNPANTHFLRLNVHTAGQGFGIANMGWGGDMKLPADTFTHPSDANDKLRFIPVKKGANYLFSIYVRGDESFQHGLRIALEDDAGAVLAEGRIVSITNQWKKYSCTLTSAATTDHARLVVLATSPGRVDLDMVSLFPQRTFKNRPNGLRPDLAQMLADMRPGFMRFPGGCIVEGMDIPNMYRWKDTIGDVSERKENWDRWMKWGAPQYYQTFGLGFFEYFQLCEDIGAEPVPVVNCGMTCQWNEKKYFMSGKDLDPFIQDALDLMEFANGSATSTWGAKRAAMGHPAPFGLKFLGVGNEQWGGEYFERYKPFAEALRAKYPGIRLVAGAGPSVDEGRWKLAWKKSAELPMDLLDEHYYVPPRWLLANAARYDTYPRKGPKVFAGEYAARSGANRNNLEGALAEAAMMTGFERNADVVAMSSYAPLFKKEGYVQWVPDLIWFDNTRVVGTPNYYAQALFSRNHGDTVLPTDVQAPPLATGGETRVGIATGAGAAEFKDFTLTRAGAPLIAGAGALSAMSGWKPAQNQWDMQNGSLIPTEPDKGGRILTGAGFPGGDLTFSFKAKKAAGSGFTAVIEGFGLSDRLQWQIGSDNNTKHILDISGQPPQSIPGSLDPGQWHAVRVEVAGPSVKCYLDGRLAQSATTPARPALFAVSSRDETASEIIVKVVNPTPQGIATRLRIGGAQKIAPAGRAITLRGDQPSDENSFAEPAKIIPREAPLTGIGPEFGYTFPAYSITVLRFGVR